MWQREVERYSQSDYVNIKIVLLAITYKFNNEI